MPLHSTSWAASDMAVASPKGNDDPKEIKVEAIVYFMTQPWKSHLVIVTMPSWLHRSSLLQWQMPAKGKHAK